MQKTTENPQALHVQSDEMTKLIRKLRWIGLEDEARKLQAAASNLPVEGHGVGRTVQYGLRRQTVR
jgi:hypothetical protein